MYIVLKVGCLECGVPTDVLGVFDAEDEAVQFAVAEYGGIHLYIGDEMYAPGETDPSKTMTHCDIGRQAQVQVHHFKK